MWVKICANTSLADAQMAVDLGADAVGFVFAPSARRVTPEEAGRIGVGLVGEVERIGVFPDWEFEAVRDAVRVAGLTGVQMHGGYQRETLRRVREEFGGGLTVAQTLHWEVDPAAGAGVHPGDPTLPDDESAGEDGAHGVRSATVAGGLLRRVREIVEEGYVDRVLVDAKVGERVGGTGRNFDWEAARALFAQAEGARLIVAGGLKPENVGEAIGHLRPWGVDVASGVEAAPGRKDRDRLRLFIENARAVG